MDCKKEGETCFPQASHAHQKRSSSIRKVAHQVLSRDECVVLKDILLAFRSTSTVPQLCSSLKQIINNDDKLKLLVEMEWMLPKEKRSDFVDLCHLYFPGYEKISRLMAKRREMESTNDSSTLCYSAQNSNSFNNPVPNKVSSSDASRGKKNYNTYGNLRSAAMDNVQRSTLKNDVEKESIQPSKSIVEKSLTVRPRGYSKIAPKKSTSVVGGSLRDGKTSHSLVPNETKDFIARIQLQITKQRPHLSALSDKGFWPSDSSECSNTLASPFQSDVAPISMQQTHEIQKIGEQTMIPQKMMEAEKIEHHKNEDQKRLYQKNKEQKKEEQKKEEQKKEDQKIEAQKKEEQKKEEQKKEDQKREDQKMEAQKKDDQKRQYDKKEDQKKEYLKREEQKKEDQKIKDRKREHQNNEDQKMEVLKTNDQKREHKKSEDQKKENQNKENQKREHQKKEDQKREHQKMKDQNKENQKREHQKSEDQKSEDKKKDDHKNEDQVMESKKSEDRKGEDWKMNDQKTESKKNEILNSKSQKREDQEVAAQKSEVRKIGSTNFEELFHKYLLNHSIEIKKREDKFVATSKLRSASRVELQWYLKKFIANLEVKFCKEVLKEQEKLLADHLQQLMIENEEDNVAEAVQQDDKAQLRPLTCKETDKSFLHSVPQLPSPQGDNFKPIQQDTASKHKKEQKKSGKYVNSLSGQKEMSNKLSKNLELLQIYSSDVTTLSPIPESLQSPQVAAEQSHFFSASCSDEITTIEKSTPCSETEESKDCQAVWLFVKPEKQIITHIPKEDALPIVHCTSKIQPEESTDPLQVNSLEKSDSFQIHSPTITTNMEKVYQMLYSSRSYKSLQSDDTWSEDSIDFEKDFLRQRCFNCLQKDGNLLHMGCQTERSYLWRLESDRETQTPPRELVDGEDKNDVYSESCTMENGKCQYSEQFCQTGDYLKSMSHKGIQTRLDKLNVEAVMHHTSASQTSPTEAYKQLSCITPSENPFTKPNTINVSTALPPNFEAHCAANAAAPMVNGGLPTGFILIPNTLLANIFSCLPDKAAAELSCISQWLSQTSQSQASSASTTSHSQQTRKVVLQATSCGSFGFGICKSEKTPEDSNNSPVICISTVNVGGSAYQKGIKPGDVILRVGAIDIRGLDAHKVGDLIRQSGKTVCLEIIPL